MRHRQVAKKSVATSIYPTSRRRPLHLVYTARSNPRLTINLVTSLLGSSRRVARTSLLGCHPGVYHSVKPEIDNNKCLVKLWRRMVNRGRIRSRIRGVFHGNNGGNEAGNRVKTKTQAGKRGIMDKNYSSSFFFSLRNSSNIYNFPRFYRSPYRPLPNIYRDS